MVGAKLSLEINSRQGGCGRTKKREENEGTKDIGG